MNTYEFEARIKVSVTAPNVSDARAAVEDVYGDGEGFVTVTKFDLEEIHAADSD